MLAKIKERENALLLRKQGLSLNEISEKLDVSKASVSLWVREVILSKIAKARVQKLRDNARERASHAKRLQTREKEKDAIKFAKNVVEQLKTSDTVLLVVCAMIYICEGNKSANDSVFFTNSDPELIALFVTLLRKVFHADESKFRVCMHLHKYHSETRQIKFWSGVTGIPKEQFIKTFQKNNHSKQRHEGYEGCVQIRYYDVKIARNLLALAREFMRMGL